MKNNASTVYALMLVVGDFLALVAAFVFAYLLRFKIVTNMSAATIHGKTYVYSIVAVLPIWILVNALIGLYHQDVYENRFSEIARLFIGSILGILTIIGFNFFTEGRLLPGRLVPIYGLIIGFGFLLLFRTLARWLRHTLFLYGVGISNILIIGNTEASEKIALAIRDTRTSGQRVLGIVGRQHAKFHHFPNFDSALDYLSGGIHSIIQTELYRDQDKNDAILRYAQEHHVAYRFVPGNSDLFVGNITVELYAGLPVIAVHQTALIGWGRLVKRLFDLLTASILLLIASPFLLIIALLIKLFDPKGPVFFRQKRLTRFNRTFTVYKFRTLKNRYSGMSPEEAFAAMGKPHLAETYRKNGDFLPNDPRISSIGRFLRHTSLDELPQLFNVVKGDISLVGPRALVPEELNEYEKRHAILSVKSGLTGLAQISGRRDITFDERRSIDMYYVQNWSFWMDISILLRTLRVVLVGQGAK